MKILKSHPVRKSRSLQVQIVTIFLFLIFTCSFLIMAFTYIRNSRSILTFSRGTIKRESALIINRIDHLINGSETVVKLTAGLLKVQEISLQEREKVIAFLFDIIEYHPYIETLYFGTPDGSFIGIVNLSLEGQTHYHADPSKPLPEGALYAVRTITHTGSSPADSWVYKDQDFKTLATETIPTDYDATTRPWYQGAAKTTGVYWTDIYLYKPLNDPGITVSQAIYDKNGKQVAIAGVDLSLSYLTPFLQERTIGKTGKAMILKSTGEVIIPQNAGADPTVAAAFAEFEKGPHANVHFKYKGVEYLASLDRFPISFGNDWLILVIAPLSDFFSDLLQTQIQVVLISLGIMALASLLVVYFSRLISRPIVLLANETEKIEHLILESDLRIKSNISEICLMDHAIASMRIALRSFSRYIPKEIVKRLVEKGQDISLGGEKKEVTIFFSDIAGFTTIAENCPTEELLVLLANYFDALSKIILKHQGTIDKYMGDSIMAFWGAPIDMPDHARQCCLAALKCKIFLTAFNARNKNEGRPEFNTRMGICSGPVIVGNIGTEERINYTVIGDSVNIASRLQAAGKTYHTAILINEETKLMIGDEFLVRPLDIIGLRGKKKETKIFELVGLISGDPALLATKEQTILCSAFTEAFEAFRSDDKKRAKELFEEIHKRFPGDFAAELYLERLR